MSGNGRSLIRSSLFRPSILEDMIRPWNEWLDDRWPFASHTPAMNVRERDDSFEITVAAPGLEKSDFKIDVNGTLLTVSVEKDQKKEEKEEGYSRREYSYTSFSRTFTLPENINKNKIDATYINGELRLILPKTEEARKELHQKISVH